VNEAGTDVSLLKTFFAVYFLDSTLELRECVLYFVLIFSSIGVEHSFECLAVFYFCFIAVTDWIVSSYCLFLLSESILNGMLRVIALLVETSLLATVATFYLGSFL